MKIANFIKLLTLCLVLYGCNQKRTPVVIRGYYDKLLQSGEITN